MFEDVADFGAELFDNFKDFSGRAVVEKGREFLRGHGTSKFLEGVGGKGAKNANKIPLIVKGGNVVLDTLGIDRDQGIRNRVKEFTGSIDASDLLDTDEQVNGGASASDTGPRANGGDTVVANQIDP